MAAPGQSNCSVPFQRSRHGGLAEIRGAHEYSYGNSVSRRPWRVLGNAFVSASTPARATEACSMVTLRRRRCGAQAGIDPAAARDTRLHVWIERMQDLGQPASAVGPVHSTARRPLADNIDGEVTPTEISITSPAPNSIDCENSPSKSHRRSISADCVGRLPAARDASTTTTHNEILPWTMADSIALSFARAWADSMMIIVANDHDGRPIDQVYLGRPPTQNAALLPTQVDHQAIIPIPNCADGQQVCAIMFRANCCVVVIVMFTAAAGLSAATLEIRVSIATDNRCLAEFI